MRNHKTGKVIVMVIVFLCLTACSKKQESLAQDSVYGDSCEENGHQMEVQWYGDPPDCTKGGYRAVICKICGWVEEEACSRVEPLGHTPQAKELMHGNCRKDTIIVYTCTVCGEETGYDRYPEADEHKWVWKESVVWDESSVAFVKRQLQCCERCNARP